MCSVDIKKISYFVEVVNEKSFSRAARNLFISQPMLSKAIRQLEDEFGAQLLNRNSKYFAVTDVGKLFYDQSIKLLNDYTELLHLLDDSEKLLKGEVSIGIPSVILTLFFPPLFSILNAEYPDIRLNLYEAGSYSVLDNVLSGDTDMGVVMMPVPMQDIDSYPILSQQCVLITSPDHPLAQKKCVDVAELRHENFIIFNERFVLNDCILQACSSRGFSPHITYQSSLDSFIFNMVSLNQGITIMPQPLAEVSPYNIRYTEISPAIPWDLALIVKKNRYLSRVALQTFNRILSYFASNPIPKPANQSANLSP